MKLAGLARQLQAVGAIRPALAVHRTASHSRQERTALYATYANDYTLICNFQIFLGEDLQTPPPPHFYLTPLPQLFFTKTVTH